MQQHRLFIWLAVPVELLLWLAVIPVASVTVLTTQYHKVNLKWLLLWLTLTVVKIEGRWSNFFIYSLGATSAL